MHIDLQRLEELTLRLVNPSSILVLEDDPHYCKMFEKALGKGGYCFQICNTGTEAVKILTEEKVDTLFLDIVVPPPDGIDILNLIRKMERKPLIVLISGAHNKDFLVSLMDVYPIVSWISKPFNEDVIREMLKIMRLAHNCKK